MDKWRSRSGVREAARDFWREWNLRLEGQSLEDKDAAWPAMLPHLGKLRAAIEDLDASEAASAAPAYRRLADLSVAELRELWAGLNKIWGPSNDPHQ